MTRLGRGGEEERGRSEQLTAWSKASEVGGMNGERVKARGRIGVFTHIAVEMMMTDDDDLWCAGR